MKRLLIKCFASLSVIAFCIVYFALQPAEAGDWNHRHKKTAVTVRKLPRGHKTVVVKNRTYHYHGGNFYRKKGPNFVVVGAPVGAVVVSLPTGHTRVVMGTGTYFYFGGVYYQSVSTGYVVVNPPIQIPNKVVVTAAVLNVRSGPGVGYGVIRTVSNGSVLIVTEANASAGWYYVQFPDGSHGWIMQRFTTVHHPSVSG
jgi:uncharacterized protein YgiM (DUF1202 family)